MLEHSLHLLLFSATYFWPTKLKTVSCISILINKVF